MMAPVLNDMLMSVLRKLLFGLGAILVSKGYFTEAEVAGYVPDLVSVLAGAVIALGAAGWSLLNKYKTSKTS
jgi:hypothetical protein